MDNKSDFQWWADCGAIAALVRHMSEYGLLDASDVDATCEVISKPWHFDREFRVMERLHRIQDSRDLARQRATELHHIETARARKLGVSPPPANDGTRSLILGSGR